MLTMAPRSESGPMMRPSSAPRRSVESMLVPVKSARVSREPPNADRASVAPAKSTSSRSQSSNRTSVSSAPRKFTESSLQPRKVTRRSSAPNTSTPAAALRSKVTSVHCVSARLVETSRTSRSHTSLNLARCSRPPWKVTPVRAHSMNRLLAACGSSKLSRSKCTPS